MTQTMTLREKQSVFALNLSKLIAKAYSMGIELTIGEVYRPEEMQAIYYKTGRSKTLNSRHQLKLAVDFNFFIKGRLLFFDKNLYKSDLLLIKPLGDYWESLNPNNVWGGDWDRDDNLDEEKFKDPYHFEMKP